MASFSTSRYFIPLFFLIFHLRTSTGELNTSFVFKNFGKDSNFEAQLALYGDAKVDSSRMALQITGSMNGSAGRVFYKEPVRLVEEESPRKKIVSFSMDFVFSISNETGDGLAFLMVPIGFPLNVFYDGPFGVLNGRKSKFLGVEFDTLRDEKYGDLNSNHVGVDVGSLVSVKVSNVSSAKLVLNSGQKLQAWIDYEATYKRLEVRLSKIGSIKPVDPLLSYPIDLSQLWNEEEVLLGLSSSSRNSSQKCNVYSWRFKLREMPHWMHSEPLDPEALMEKGKQLNVHKKTDCAMRILAALIFGTGCGALGAFIVLFLWTIFGNRRPVLPEDYAVQPQEFDPKKFKVVVDKAIEDGKK